MSERVLRPGDQTITPIGRGNPNASESYARMLGLLRDIRAEVQNLENTLTKIVELDEMEDSESRDKEIIATVANNQSIYDYNSGEINLLLRQLQDLIQNDADLYDRYGDEITHIENHWERAKYDWPYLSPVEDAQENPTLPITEIVRQAKKVIEHLERMIYHAGLLTIPARLNQHLDQLRIGQALNFNTTFEDEVSNEEDRQKILEYLEKRPMVVKNGIVDVVNGLVFHASPDMARRRFSYILIGISVLVGAILVAIISEAETLFNLQDWPVAPGNLADLIVGYSFVIVGGVVHLGIDAVKQARSGTRGRGVMALEDWLLWVHINEIGVIIGIVSIWIGFFGMIFINQGPIGWQTAFLVGYSIDSFVDMFLQRFHTVVSTRTGTIKA